MPRRKKEDVVEGPSPAEMFAKQRKLVCLSKEEGEVLMGLLKKAGVRLRVTGSADLRLVRIPDDRQFVVDVK